MANQAHVGLVKQGAAAIRQWREQNRGAILDLAGVNLREADLRGLNLDEADLKQADLRQANLSGATLRRANLAGADLEEADLHGTILWEANLWEANLYQVRGAEQASFLETVRFMQVAGIQVRGSGDDALHFEECHRPWQERLVDWERLRTVGRLPLFGLSYTAVILIPIVFYVLAFYNDNIDLVRAWAVQTEQVVTAPDDPLQRLARLLQERLHPRPIPSLSLMLLASTVLLALASTLYTWRCPSIIKEYGRAQWHYGLGRSLLHYWPYAWKERYVRFICATCYFIGGLLAAWVIGTKVWQTGWFIFEHSTFSWPWR